MDNPTISISVTGHGCCHRSYGSGALICCFVLLTLPPLIAAEPNGSQRYSARKLSASALQTELAQADQRQQRLGQRATEVEAELNKLLDDVKAVQPQERQTQKPDAQRPEPQKVHFRPPMRRDATKLTLGVICEDNRISVVNYSKFREAIGPITRIGDYRAELPDSDFHFEQRVNSPLDQPFTMTRKPGRAHRGETVEEAEQAGSRFQQFLQEHDSGKYYLEFEVYPESHETFRKVRRLVWHEYEVNWLPRVSGEPIRDGWGRGSVQ